jgi:FtsP/CotA-like multicopper oxidase with cupredoxin domain
MAAGHNSGKMVRTGMMSDQIFRLNRRQLMAGLGACVLGPALAPAAAQGRRSSLMLQARAGVIALRKGEPETPIWSLQGQTPDGDFRFKRGDTLEITFRNELPVPTVLNWYGMDGIPAAEPLAARPPVAPGAMETFALPLRHAGTLMMDLRLLGDAQARPSRPRTLIVEETEPASVDRDQALLIEEWRLRPDGTAIAPGIDPKDAVPLYTINGQTTLDIPARTNERLRFRFINGGQRNVLALKIEGHEVRVMAIDGQPAEPFPARGGALVLAPGTRVDAFIDVTAAPGSASPILLHDGKEARPIGRLVIANEPPVRPAPLPPAPALPSNGLPTQIELRGASRFELTLGGPQADWMAPATFAVSTPPAFRAKAARAVVLALTNRANVAMIFHLHGHHFRLLDRLDDGWKPFWLDTLAIEPGQTQRITFAAQYAGPWLVEAMATDWAAPRMVRWYSVE